MNHTDTGHPTGIGKSILGCLYGQAIGDAMGMPAELWTKRKVVRHFGWIDGFLPGPRENRAARWFEAGEFTDDTGQCVALMDAIIEAEGAIEPATIAKHIMLWAKRTGALEKDILGPTSKLALAAIDQGVAFEAIAANGVTNGSAMRVAPIGCLLDTGDKAAFVEGVRLSCLPTHKSDMAIAGATAIAWAISRAIEGASWEQIKTGVVPLANDTQRHHESTFSPLLGERIRYALRVMEDQHDEKQALDDLYEMVGAGMDIIESIPAAIALVDLAGTKPMKCATLAANLGGDTDTIGAMATAICGALRGIGAFDRRHIALINRVNDVDFTPYAQALAAYRLARGPSSGTIR